MRTALRLSPHFAAALLIGLIAASSGTAADKPISDEQIAALVEDLISPNKEPSTGGPYAKYPPGYNRLAQGRVKRAFHQLRDLAPRSFPFLFDHLDDERYSLTEDSGDVDRNYSVGELCRDILKSHLQPDVWGHKAGGTSSRRRPGEPDYLDHYKLFKPEHAKKWWDERQDKTLRELQLEVLEWVLAEEEKAPDKYTEAQRERVRKRLTELRNSKEPFKPGYPFSR